MTKKVFDHAEVIRRREELGLSRQELAKASGIVRVATVREIELGSVPGGNTVALLAAGLGCKIDDLYRVAPEPGDAQLEERLKTDQGFNGGRDSKPDFALSTPEGSAPSSPGAE